MEAIVWNKKLWLEALEGAHSCSLKANLDEKLIQARKDALEEAAKIAENLYECLGGQGEFIYSADVEQAIRQAKEKV